MAKEFCFPFPLKHGLHARPASLFQETAERFISTITWINERTDISADAKSTLALVATDTMLNDPCRITIQGVDEVTALTMLSALLKGDFLHVDDDLSEPQAGTEAYVPRIIVKEANAYLQGIPISRGIAIAPAVFLDEEAVPSESSFAAFAGEENECAALQHEIEELEHEWIKRMSSASGKTERDILKVQLAILKDKEFAARTTEFIIKDKISASFAVKHTAEFFAEALMNSQSSYLRERITDIRDVAGNLSRRLAGITKASFKFQRTEPAICFAETLTPSQLLSLDKRYVKGLVLGRIGVSSHTAILLRAYGIPCVDGIMDGHQGIGAGTEILIDGSRGLVLPTPSLAVKRYYQLEHDVFERLKKRYARFANVPARTADGRRIEIGANIGVEAEAEIALAYGAEGIGVFRTEYLFMDREAPPSEEEQFKAYCRAAAPFSGKPVIIRLLDIGGDKPVAYLNLPHEHNPFLGRRAVRMYPDHEELIKTQIRAVLRAAVHGELRIMIPMVCHTKELLYIRNLISSVAAELKEKGIPHRDDVPVGIMIEVPSVAFSLDQMEETADFFSIGSNDLAQYFFAVDRGDKEITHLANPMEPSFLQLLHKITIDLRTRQKWIGLCGEIAGQKKFLPLMVGLGLSELSMSSPLIPEIKALMSELDSNECQQLLNAVLLCDDARAVEDMLEDFGELRSKDKIIGIDIIRIDSDCVTRDEVIKEMIGMLMVAGRIDTMDAVEEAIWQREDVCSTGVGFGTAIPHCKSPAVRVTSIVFLKLRKPIYWHSVDEQPADLVFMIAIHPGILENEHLKLIARLSRTLMHEEFRDSLRATRDLQSILDHLSSILA